MTEECSSSFSHAIFVALTPWFWLHQKSSKVDDHENNSEMKSEEEEPCDSPDGDDDIGNGHKRDDNRSTDTRQSEVNSGAGVDNESHLDGGSLFTESGGGRRAAKLGMLAGRPLCAAVSHDGYYISVSTCV